MKFSTLSTKLSKQISNWREVVSKLVLFTIPLIPVCGCMYRYVITMGLRSKYDMDGDYFRFAVRILEIMPCMTSHYCCYVPLLYCMQLFNVTLPIKRLHTVTNCCKAKRDI